MENIKRFNLEKPEEMELDTFFRDADMPYSKREQELLNNFIAQLKELKQKLGIKSFEELKELAKNKKDWKKNIELLRKLNTILEKIHDAMARHYFEELDPKITEVSAETKEGRQVEFDFAERLEYWRNFYEQNGVYWVSLPDKIALTTDQAKEMEQLIKDFGFDHMIIVPDDIVGEPVITSDGLKNSFYVELAEKTEALVKGREQFNINFNGFDNIKDKRKGLRIVLLKDTKQEKDNIFLKTFKDDISEVKDFLKNTPGLSSLTLSEYMIWQRDFFLREKKYPDSDGNSPGTLLIESFDVTDFEEKKHFNIRVQERGRYDAGLRIIYSDNPLRSSLRLAKVFNIVSPKD